MGGRVLDLRYLEHGWVGEILESDLEGSRYKWMGTWLVLRYTVAVGC